MNTKILTKREYEVFSLLILNKTTKEIAENLKAQYKIEIDKKKIMINETIKVLGITTVDIKLYEGIIGKLKVQVVAS